MCDFSELGAASIPMRFTGSTRAMAKDPGMGSLIKGCSIHCRFRFHDWVTIVIVRHAKAFSLGSRRVVSRITFCW